MPTIALTVSFTRDVQANDAEAIYWDQRLPGFGLRVRASGHKSFIVQYRAGGASVRRMTLGQVGILTLDQARTHAQQLLAEVKIGRDPAAQRKAQRERLTWQVVAERYMKEHVARHCAASTERMYHRLLEKFVIPDMGKRWLGSVEALEVEQWIASLSANPVQANRVLALVAAIHVKAVHWRLISAEQNPCLGIRKNSEKPKQRFLSDDEISRLQRHLDAKFEEGLINRSVLDLIRLLLLTGARVDEMKSLRWSQVSFDRGLIRIEKHKLGRKGAKTITITPGVLQVLQRQPRLADCDFVFPGRSGTAPISDIQKIWSVIRAQIGLSDVRLHDLRHTYASVGIAEGLTLPVIGRLLGHRSISATMVYAHINEEHLRVSAGKIAKNFEVLL